MNNNIMLGLMSSKYTNKKRIQDVYVENMNYCVYFVTDGQYIKIGVAASLPNRIKQLQTGNPRRIKAIYVIKADTQRDSLRIENELHKAFKNNHILGEWFELEERDIANYCVKRNYDLRYPVSRFDFDVDGIRIVP